MKSKTRFHRVAREAVAAEQLDRYLTRELQKMPGFESVTVSVGYRLCAPDKNGCNWSGHVVPMHGMHSASADSVSRKLRPFIKAAQACFNLSE